jgi:hypothetical protein
MIRGIEEITSLGNPAPEFTVMGRDNNLRIIMGNRLEEDVCRKADSTES